MSDEPLIRVDKVSKSFCRNLKKSLLYGVCDIASDLLGKDRSGKKLRQGEFWANREVSFELKRGECLGLIGRNGAGKTTLLKMLNGLIKPDGGSIEMKGRVSALIALGAGFNPILTGRENVFIAGSVLGLEKKEIEARYDEIVEFAELGDFMESPVQNYSSGMQVRLGFAVASTLDPDVLIIDEVLAVGDSAFRNKCYERVGNMLKNSAVILVTHNMAHVGRICSKALVMHRGEPRFLGDVSEGIQLYDSLNSEGVKAIEARPMLKHPVVDAEVEFDKEEVAYSESLNLVVDVDVADEERGCFAYIYFFDSSDAIVAQWQTLNEGIHFCLKPGKQRLEFEIGPLHLRKGAYRMSLIIKDATGLKNLIWSDRRDKLTVTADFFGEGHYQVPTLRHSHELSDSLSE